MSQERRDAFIQAVGFFATLLEYILFAVSILADHAATDIGFYVVVLLSSLSMALSNEIGLFESGVLLPRLGDPPRLHFFTRMAMASQGVVIALDMLFLGLLGSSPSLFIPHAWLLIAVLAALALPQLGIEWTSLRWRFDSLASDAKDEVSVNAIRHERPATHGVVATGKRNREAFEYLWEGVILPQCEKMRSANSGIHVDPYAKERVWERYVALNRHVSYTYMRHPDSLIDRHKVAACYSYAVLQAQPLHVTEETLASKPRASTANERLAMVVACSIVAAELRSVLRELDGIDDDCRASALERLDKGLRFPEHVGHGDYEESVLASLRHTRAEGTYNVLQYALLIFHWERCTFGDNVHRAILHHYRLLQKREHAPLD